MAFGDANWEQEQMARGIRAGATSVAVHPRLRALDSSGPFTIVAAVTEGSGPSLLEPRVLVWNSPYGPVSVSATYSDWILPPHVRPANDREVCECVNALAEALPGFRHQIVVRQLQKQLDGKAGVDVRAAIADYLNTGHSSHRQGFGL